MQLAKLELVGFKSFADRTEFEFEPGLTALVGPNGCGKSNVVDAVRWILGSQSPKSLRSNEMQDIIFAGTESRRGAGYAEASLTLLNTKGLLPTEYKEVCITRRLYRTGESEYFINKQPCRLKDIRNLLADTGLGVDTYSLIEQGKVDRILTANPQERRAIFEEAAGISGFKAQRKEAEAKLARAADNLARVNDIIAEKERQLRSIKAQAARARRHRELTERLRELSVSLARREYERMNALRRECLEKIAALEAEARRLQNEINRLEAEHQRLEAKRNEEESQISLQSQALHQVENDKRAIEERIRSGQLRLQELDNTAREAAQRLGALAERHERSQSDLDQALRELEEIRAIVIEQTEAVNTQVKAAAEAAAEHDRLNRAIEDWRGRVVDIVQKAAALRNEIAHLEGSRGQEISRRGRLLARDEELAAGLVVLAAQIEAESARLADARQEAMALASRRQETADALAVRTADLNALAREAEELRTQWTARVSRRDTLRELEARAEGVGQGVCALVQGDTSQGRVEGILGMIADVLRAEMAHAAAIDAALGERAQYVVVDSTDHAREAITRLQTRGAGRAGLLPLDWVNPATGDGAAFLGRPGVVGRALDLVQTEPTFLPAAHHLLRDTLIVDTLEDALRYAREAKPGLRFVTRDGQVVEAGGAIVGGTGTAQGGLITRRSELALLDREIAKYEARLCEAEARRQAHTAEATQLRQALEALTTQLTEKERTVAQREGTVAHLRRQHDRLQEERQVIRSEVQEIDRNIRSCLEREEAIRAQLAEAERRHEELHGQVEAAKMRLQEQREKVEVLAREVEALRISLAQKEEKQGSLDGRVARLREAIAEIERERASVEEQIETYRHRKEEAERQLAADQAQVTELCLAAERATRELETLRAANAQSRAQQHQIEGDLRARRAQLETLHEEIQRERLAENEHAIRLNELERRVREEFEVALATAPAADAAERNWDQVKAEIADLQEQLKRLGPVNLEAIAEQDELEEAIAFRARQRDDLLVAEKELKELIQRLNRISRERFVKTFEEIRQNFREIFRKMFGGGRADIRLEEGVEDVLEAGIEIYASPPEKELRSINLLSGGEKTMVAIALLFAVFKTKPSPFCILDEVDAALDEANIARFAAMLQDFVKDSQFIIVTHSKRTMSAAEILYGITMEERGISKRVAVRLDEAARMVA